MELKRFDIEKFNVHIFTIKILPENFSLENKNRDRNPYLLRNSKSD